MKQNKIQRKTLSAVVQQLSRQAIRSHNRKLLTNYYTFKPSAPLKTFLQQKLTVVRNFYTLRELLLILNRIIRDEMMYDQQNPCIILCSPLLEKTLNMKALHFCEIPELVIKQLYCLTEKLQKDCHMHLQKNPQLKIQDSDECKSDKRKTDQENMNNSTSKINGEIFKDPNARFRMCTNLHNVLCNKKEKEIFTYREISTMLSEYIISKKETIFDLRNPYVALIAYDPLSHAFEVKAFHKNQVAALLRKHLFLVKNI